MRSLRGTTALLTCFLLTAAPSRAASDCQPIYDAYAAMFQKPAVKRTITTPGMAAPVEMVLTPDAIYSRIGAKDSWGKVELDAATRSVMRTGTPSPETVTECRVLARAKVRASPLRPMSSRLRR